MFYLLNTPGGNVVLVLECNKWFRVNAFKYFGSIDTSVRSQPLVTWTHRKWSAVLRYLTVVPLQVLRMVLFED